MPPDEVHACRSATARQQKSSVAPRAWAAAPLAELCACTGGLLIGIWTISAIVRKLERPGVRLRFCYEAGPTGYGLTRQIDALGHECALITPSLIPRRAGERVKTNRGDAVKLARLFRAGESTEIWTPDETHEAMRDFVRTRESAVKDRTRKRQEIRSFLLRLGKRYPARKAWGTKYFRCARSCSAPPPAASMWRCIRSWRSRAMK